MKILLAHKIWHVKGGVEQVLFSTNALLEAQGHEVIPFACAHPDNVPTPYASYYPPYRDLSKPRLGGDALKAAGNIIYSREARRAISRLLDDVRPDIAHCRNIYHHLSPSILLELKARGIPIVMQVADYKLICPNYRMFQHGHVCELCRGGKYYNCLTHACAGGSVASSALLTAEAYIHRMLRMYSGTVDAYISPSSFMKQKMVDFGIPEEKITVINHFIDVTQWDEEGPAMPSERPYIVVSGRVSEEKGIDVLVRAIASIPEADIVVVGKGPAEESLQELASSLGARNVRFVGFKSAEELRSIVRGSVGAVVPSIWYEVFGMSVIEAMALAKPVIASRTGGMTDLIRPGVDGFTFEVGNVEELAEHIRTLLSDPERTREMGRSARRKMIEEHSPDTHLAAMMDVYNSVLPRGVADE